jgi:hypothetical protein
MKEMKKKFNSGAFLLLLVMVFSFSNEVKSQTNLVVGYFNPNETLVLDGVNAQYDTVVVLNKGHLTVRNSTITVNVVMYAIDSAVVDVSNSAFTVSGNIGTAGNSDVTLKGTLDLNCSLSAIGNSYFKIDSANVNCHMSFVHQYNLVTLDSGHLDIRNTQFNTWNGKYGGGFLHNSSFTQFNNTYTNTIGMSMTVSVSNNASFTASYCTGGLELIIEDAATIDLDHSDIILPWFNFKNGDVATLDFPPTLPVFPPSSNVVQYDFPGSLPGVSGVDYNVSIDSCNTVYWALLVHNGSNVTVSNDSLLAVGLFYYGNATETLDGFNNNQVYTSFTPDLSDRNLSIQNSNIFAWNFYTADTSTIIVKNCNFGEILTFGHGRAEIYNSSCDGTGGFFGSNENSSVYARNANFFRLYPGYELILNNGNSNMELELSEVTGSIMLNNDAQLLLNNTTHSGSIVVNQSAYELVVFIDSINPFSADTIIGISGSLRDVKGPTCPKSITRYVMSYSTADSLNITQIADTSCSPSISNALIRNWNTSGLTSGNYILWLQVYVDDSLTCTATRPFTVSGSVGNENFYTDDKLVKIFPNPSGDKINIEFYKPAPGNYFIVLFDMEGKEILRAQQKNFIDVSWIKAGNYLLIIELDGLIYKESIVISR